MKMKFNNSEGEVFYGMHMCPGVVEYPELTEDPANPYRVLVTEDVIRKLNPSFVAKPMFVQHVEEDVPDDLDEVKHDADGWVVESFYNAPDGLTWCKFIVTSELGLQKIKAGWKLSNSYFYELDNRPGTHNAVPYIASVTAGKGEHIAIVRNPRYKQSQIFTPEQFNAYNEQLLADLKKFQNSEGKKEKKPMKFNIFKRQKVENSIDLEGLVVELPLSKKEVPLTKAIDGYDKFLNMNGYANGDHMVKVNDSEEMSVNDLVKKHQDLCNEMSAAKDKKADNVDEDDGGEPGSDDGGEPGSDDDSMDNSEVLDDSFEDVGDRGGDESLNNEDDSDKDDVPAKKKDEKAKNKASNSVDMSVEQARKVLAKEKARKLKNANSSANFEQEVATVSLPQDKMSKGKAMFGSN